MSSLSLRIQQKEPANGTSLHAFTLFPDLPLDIRLMIWEAAIPPSQILLVEVDVPEEVDEDEETESAEEKLDKYEMVITAIDSELNERLDELDFYIKDHLGQTQLEAYGFTCSRAQPVMQNKTQLQETHHRTRVAAKNEGSVRIRGRNNEVPALLQLCSESRNFLRSSGYGLAFSTYTSPARFWVNFKNDVFVVTESAQYYYENNHRILDGGTFNLGQCPPLQLGQVRRVAVTYNPFYNLQIPFGEVMPDEFHELVQLFGNLEELLFIDGDGYPIDMLKNNIPSRDPILVETGIEELLGHYSTWQNDHNRGLSDLEWYHEGPRVFRYGRPSYSLPEVAADLEEQLRTHPPQVHPMMDEFRAPKGSWSTPKLRFVAMIDRKYESELVESRRRYRDYIESKYQEINKQTAGMTQNELAVYERTLGRSVRWYSETRARLASNA